jgi:hypothetical protein
VRAPRKKTYLHPFLLTNASNLAVIPLFEGRKYTSTSIWCYSKGQSMIMSTHSDVSTHANSVTVLIGSKPSIGEVKHRVYDFFRKNNPGLKSEPHFVRAALDRKTAKGASVTEWEEWAWRSCLSPFHPKKRGESQLRGVRSDLVRFSDSQQVPREIQSVWCEEVYD